jgi:DNA repair protein RecN (Recombination protein N)
MLKYLEIHQFALIDHLEIEFQKGLNLLTGETGSGKSIIVDALGLLLGAKGFVEMVRTGADKAKVSGLFESLPDKTLQPLFEANGLDFTAGELIIKREISIQGKSRAFVNNQLVPVSFLREMAPRLADVHGQNESQTLNDSASQLLFLDSYASATNLRNQVRSLWDQYQESWNQLQSLRLNEQKRLQSMDLLNFQINEIEKAQLTREDEDLLLAAEHRVLANADKIFQISSQVYEDLYNGNGSAVRLLKQANRLLEELKRLDNRTAEFLPQLETAKIALEDVSFSLREYFSHIEVNPARLESVESRISEIERLKKKYGKSVREILDFYQKCRKELASLESADESMQGLENQLSQMAELYRATANRLTEKRAIAARQLEKCMEKELAQLSMEKTRFQAELHPFACGNGFSSSLTGGPTGIEDMEFLLSPNPGEDLKPLAKIASGGEISRIMLALKSVATIDDRNKCLVFDEVDSGIGGQTADVVGQKLKRLSKHNQIICVTHLPQIASYADCHHYILKKVDKGRTRTQVILLQGQQRVQELARMLSGDRLTDNVLKHAAEMIQRAGK